MDKEPNVKISKLIWVDVLKDLVGFDKGYYYTLKGIYTDPGEVLESYYSRKGKYLSPFTLLGISFSLYYLISGFLVDWDLVSDAIKHFYRLMLEWQVNLLSSKGTEARNLSVEKTYQDAIVPMVNGVILVASRYLIFLVMPMQIIFLYPTSLFSRKIGVGFYDLFLSFNYYFSFSLLFLNASILISLVYVWLLIPCLLIFNYFFYGHFFRSFGDKRKMVKSAFLKGAVIGFLVIMLLGSATGLIWGRLMAS